MQRSLVIGILALTLWGILLSVGVAVYVRYDPSHLAVLATEKIAATFGVRCHIDRLKLGVWSGIHVRLEGLELELPHESRFTARAVTLYMGLSSLLHVRFIPGQIVLDSPRLIWNTSEQTPLPKGQQSGPSSSQKNGLHIGAKSRPGTDPLQLNSVPAAAAVTSATAASAAVAASTTAASATATSAARAIADLFRIPKDVQGLRIRIENGQFFSTQGARGPRLSALGLHGNLRLPGIFSGSAALQLDELLVAFPKTGLPLPLSAALPRHLGRAPAGASAADTLDAGAPAAGATALTAGTAGSVPPFFSLRNLSVRVNGVSLPAEAHATLEIDRLELATQLQVDGLAQGQLGIELAVTSSSDTNSPKSYGRMRLEGELSHTEAIPLTLDIPFELRNKNTLHIERAKLEIGANDPDSATFSGDLDLGSYSIPEGLFAEHTNEPNAQVEAKTGLAADARPNAVAPVTKPNAKPDIKPDIKLDAKLDGKSDTKPLAEPTLSGLLELHHLSLPRWFSFARDLPGGIERALDNLRGTLKIVLTARSLSVPHLTASLCGMEFTGSGGVPNFAKPEIRLKANTASADINAIMPELMDQAPGPLPWTHAALVSSDPDSEGPDYMIHLTADKANAWKFTMGRFAFRCTPMPGGSRLNIDAGQFYGGSLTSITDISHVISVNAQLDKVAIDKPALIVSGSPLLGGTAQGQASLTGRKDSFVQFLASLSGTIHMQVASGYLGRRVDAGQIPFESFQLTGKMAGTGFEGAKPPARLGYGGTWSIATRTRDWEYTLSLNGTPLFDSHTFTFMGFAEAPGRLQWNGLGFTADMRARFGLDLDKDLFTLRQGEGRIDGGSFSASLASTQFSGHPNWKGTVSLNTTALGRILQHNALLPADMPDGALQHVQLSADVEYSDKKLAVNKLKGRVDDTSVAGFIQRSQETSPGGQQLTRPAWQADLELGALNLSRYLPKRTPGTQAQPWPRGLLDLRAKGVVSLQSLTLSKLVQRAVRIPFVVDAHRLSCAPISFTPYGGRGEGELEITAEAGGYRSRLRYASTGADMARFSQEAGLKTILGGSGKAFAEVAGLLNGAHDIPAALNGNWSFEVVSGTISERDSKLSPMLFNSISTSGIMREGVLITKNIALQSPTLTARGVADINLVNWTLDCRLNVSTQAFTNVPVTYRGSLDAPERSINALNAVAGAIGKLGSGLFGLVGDILSAPFKLLK